jgi:hypothetical protein
VSEVMIRFDVRHFRVEMARARDFFSLAPWWTILDRLTSTSLASLVFPLFPSRTG